MPTTGSSRPCRCTSGRRPSQEMSSEAASPSHAGLSSSIWQPLPPNPSSEYVSAT